MHWVETAERIEILFRVSWGNESSHGEERRMAEECFFRSAKYGSISRIRCGLRQITLSSCCFLERVSANLRLVAAYIRCRTAQCGFKTVASPLTRHHRPLFRPNSNPQTDVSSKFVDPNPPTPIQNGTNLNQTKTSISDMK